MKITLTLPHTVIEPPDYLAQAKSVISAETQDNVVNLVASDPKCGILISGTGGVRKSRIANKTGKGKSGGARVVYFFHNSTIPVVLMSVFDKGEKDNLTKAEKNGLRKLTRELTAELSLNNQRKPRK